MVRVIVTGDRNWDCPELARAVVAGLVARHGDVMLVHGDATGVDRAFAAAGREAGCEVLAYPADWDLLGPRAGPHRNGQMVADGAAFVIAVHRKLYFSRGTRDCVRRALAAGLPVWLIETADPGPDGRHGVRRIRRA